MAETQELPHLQSLNADQRRAASAGITPGRAGGPQAGRPLLIIAGAGTGKTNTLAHRLAHLIVAGADPARILLMTFSRRAADEMTRRARGIAREALRRSGRPGAVALPWSGTFHAVANRLLRLYAERIGIAADFSILDRGDAADLMNVCRSDLGFAKARRRFPTKHTCLDIYSRCINSQIDLKSALDSVFPWCAEWQEELTALFRAYVELKQGSNGFDYDDLLLYWYHMTRDEGLAGELGGRFDFVLVDEYQDTNRLQADILLAMKPAGQGVTVVGDDAQAIYGFRAATVDNILNFPGHFDPPAEMATLTRNYRSQPAILALANALIAQSKRRYDKPLTSERPAGVRPAYVKVEDEDQQVHYVVRQILANRERGETLREQAVLFRNAHHADALELELNRRNIPYVKYGGLKFLEAAHVKDFVAMLRWLHNPRDRAAATRVLMLLPGVGPGWAKRCWEHYAARDHQFAALEEFSMPAASAERFATLTSLLSAAGSGKITWPAMTEPLIDWYRPYLEERFASVDTRAADLTSLAAIAARNESCESFISTLTLDPPAATSDLAGEPHLDDDYLILSTVHSAKGQEWQSVFLLNVVDGTFPSEFATGDEALIEEERRLMYVAVTRAKSTLHLIHPLRFFVPHQPRNGGRHVYSAASRFMTDALVSLTDEQYVGAGAGGAREAASSGPALDLHERIRQLW